MILNWMWNTLEFDPALVDFIEVDVVECAVELSGELIVEWSFSIKFVVDPLSRICGPVGTIVKSSLAVDAIIFEITLIVNSILIN